MRLCVCFLLLFSVLQNVYSQSASPLKLSNIVYSKFPQSQQYDTLHIKYDELGREVEQSVISQISSHNNNTWHRFTTEYDSLDRELGGVVYSLNGSKTDPPYYIRDTVMGNIDSSIVQIWYSQDTTYEKWTHSNGWSSLSYEILDKNGRIIEEVEFNKREEYKMKKIVFRDTINRIKITKTQHFKNSGMLWYTETDSLFCDSQDRGIYVVKNSTKKRTTHRRSVPSFDCNICIHQYSRDSLDRVYQITKLSTVGDTLSLENYEYNEQGKVTKHKKSIPYGKVEDKTYQYDRYGNLTEYRMLRDDELFLHQIHHIRYKSK